VRELPATRIYILTADASELDAAEVTRRGLQGLLTKDHSVAEIIVAIRPALRPSCSAKFRIPRRLFGLA